MGLQDFEEIKITCKGYDGFYQGFKCVSFKFDEMGIYPVRNWIKRNQTCLNFTIEDYEKLVSEKYKEDFKVQLNF